MTEQRKAITFDVDPDSLATLREALPEWEIEVTRGATARARAWDWSPGAADLLVVGVRNRLVETIGLCRGLRSKVSRAQPPLLVLVLPAQQALVSAALEAGADSCLVLPVHAKELVSRVTRAREGNRPGRHTLSLHQAREENPWQDEGGEA